ncbi:MAG: DUF2973 domain-containing protein [Hydrococcus sp. C42_A2020_068]|uniref:DUF2973 domain-containing protein n=1 Tax=Pleurocapsa sp. PCC 7327 TaxID=118163 RepID=UPI00029FB4C2|nr:DUF2973 domain-containing protein [Pleurocapsa sp. PCC 7327]AFY78865.1 Protein of unknown function (DUF2973) [Pleurocapsa sp. PCC 7327]MBF2020580.1 DUF2973 domain-containing protein [Hydrococcus sp. C42_A2020_068]
MLHLMYILAFTVIAFLAISNLIRSLVTVSMDSQRRYSAAGKSSSGTKEVNWNRTGTTVHPELLDESGQPIDEPLLVMRSVTVEDARQQLDALYKASPGQTQETEEDA